jgi:two-component system LytT family response regulator
MKLDGLLSDLKRGVKYPERLAVKSNGRIVFLRLTDIDLAEASDNYVKLYAGGDSYMFRETLTALEEKLAPERFLRISRSIIVNIESVKELQPMFHGEYVVLLRNGTKVTLTRGYRKQLQQLGVTL